MDLYLRRGYGAPVLGPVQVEEEPLLLQVERSLAGPSRSARTRWAGRVAVSSDRRRVVRCACDSCSPARLVRGWRIVCDLEVEGAGELA